MEAALSGGWKGLHIPSPPHAAARCAPPAREWCTCTQHGMAALAVVIQGLPTAIWRAKGSASELADL